MVWERERGQGKHVCAGVVACGNAVEVLAAPLFEGAKLDKLVAHDIGIGGKSFADRVDGIGYNVFPILFVEIDFLEAQTILPGEKLGDFNILFGRTVDESTHGFGNIGERTRRSLILFHTNTDVEKGRFEPLLFEQMNHNGTVYTSRHQSSHIHNDCILLE